MVCSTIQRPGGEFVAGSAARNVAGVIPFCRRSAYTRARAYGET